MAYDGGTTSRTFGDAFSDPASRARLNSRLNHRGLIIDLGGAGAVDYLEYFMCWQLTQVLAPSVAEKVPPAVVRRALRAVSNLSPKCRDPSVAPRASRGDGQFVLEIG